MNKEKTSAKQIVHTLLFGGLGNQLFIYAMARRLSLANDTELILDTVTGFIQDAKYQRQYELHNFCLHSAVTLRTSEDKFAKFRRRLMPLIEKSKPVGRRKFIREPAGEFLPDIVNQKLQNTVYLEGYWQSHKYFSDIAEILKNDLKFQTPICLEYKSLQHEIVASQEAVAIHVRRKQYDIAIEGGYYNAAIHQMLQLVPECRLYCFSDDPHWCKENLASKYPVQVIYDPDVTALDDFKLMTCCQHFIIANSSFSWWAAWLGEQNKTDSIVMMPDKDWYLARPGNSPDSWLRIK